MIKDFIFTLLKQYGNPILFLGLAAEYLGLPFVPGEGMLSFMGYLGLKGLHLTILFSILCASAGTFTGSMAAWFIGYRFGESAVLKLGKPIHLDSAKLDSFKASFDKHQFSLIVFSRFVPGVRHIIPYVSGISRVKAGKYAILSLVGSFIWCGSFIGLGSLVGAKWNTIIKLAKTYSLALLLLIIFIYVTVRFFKNHQTVIFTIAFPLFIFFKISEDVIKKELSAFDSNIYNFVASFITEDMTDLMKFLTFLGSGITLAAITILVIIATNRMRKYTFYGWAIVFNLLLSSLLNELFKIFFHRERPDILRLIDITGFSFPSGHSMIGLCFYGLIIYILWAKMKSRLKYPLILLLVALIVSIGISRIYLGVHYASDVLGGFSAGLAWLSVYITICNNFNKNYSLKN